MHTAAAHPQQHAPLSPEFQAALMQRIQGVPVMKELRMEVLKLAEGCCEMRMAHEKKHDGIFHSFHGGLMMTAADTAACWAVLTRAGPQAVVTTTDMHIRFLAACLTDLTVKARLIKAGRTMNPVHVDLYDAHSKHVAVAQVNYMILEKIPRRPQP